MKTEYFNYLLKVLNAKVKGETSFGEPQDSRALLCSQMSLNAIFILTYLKYLIWVNLTLSDFPHLVEYDPYFIIAEI